MGKEQSRLADASEGAEANGSSSNGHADVVTPDAPARQAHAAPNGGGDGEEEGGDGGPSEGQILAKLLMHLGQRPDQTMPLSEIIEGLPPQVRAMASNSDAVRGWLNRFAGLLEVVGEPGNEQVVFTVAKPQFAAPRSRGPAASPVVAKAPAQAASPTATAAAAAPAAAAHRPALPNSRNGAGPVRAGPVSDGSGVAVAATTALPSSNAVLDDEGLTNPCTIQLRGLPFRATLSDIRNFLGDHVSQLTRDEPPIRLLLNKDGRPSGFARVQFSSPQAALTCRDALHRRPMGDRYIEVLACSDRAGKARARRATDGIAGPGAEVEPQPPVDAQSEQLERERILEECRSHLRQPGCENILLSMLGIALSPPARAYLRRANLGLKHFLGRFPNEFHVEGPKGCEKITWTPNSAVSMPMELDAMRDGAAQAGQLATMEVMANWAHHGSHLHATATGMLTPKRRSPSPGRGGPAPASVASHCMATPSDWGTPGTAMMGVGGPALPGGMDYASIAGGPGWGTFWPGPWANAYGSWDQGDLSAGTAAFTAKANTVKKVSGTASDAAAPASTAPSARSHAHLHPQSHPFAHRAPEAGAAATAPASASEPFLDDKTGAPALRLRGLPFNVSDQDVLAFFAQHDVADRIADVKNACQLLPKANGRPSGQAVVQMRSRYDAEVAQQALSNQFVGQRFIEVFVYGSDPEDGSNSREPEQQAQPPGTTQAAVQPTWPDWAMQGFGSSVPWAPPWSNLPPPPIPGAAGMVDFSGGQQLPFGYMPPPPIPVASSAMNLSQV